MFAILNRETVRNVVVNIISFLFVLLFVYAATSKLLDFETFTVQLAQSPLLSAYAGIIAWMVPGIEIAIALLLIFPRLRILALYACFTLMVMFTAYIYIILNFSDFIPCSCGGVLEKLSWTQHLVFNVVFIILAGVAIIFSNHWNFKKKLLGLGVLAVVAIPVVVLLFVFSEKKMQRNNAFQRRYMPHPIEMVHSFDLEYSSYYFAGVGNGKIYLGNTTAPLLMTVIDSSFTDTTKTMIQLDQMDLPYRSVQVRVVPPTFYVVDGTVPIILQGTTANWLAKTKMEGDYYFNHIYAIDSSTIAVKSHSSETMENIIGIIEIGSHIKGNFSDKLLEKQIDGIFDTDGKLIYNDSLRRIIHTYTYRNEYLIIDEDLGLDVRGKTIDTVSTAQVHIEEDITRNQKKLGSNTVLINNSTATAGKYLFINSPRLGKLEPEDMLDEASIIDVYDLTDQSYRFSFYLYSYKRSKVREFRVLNGILYALQGNYLVAYSMNTKFFK